MRDRSVDEVVKRLAKTKPSLLRRSAERVARILEGHRVAKGEQVTSTFPPVRKGAPPETVVNFSIHFVESTGASDRPLPQLPPGVRRKGLAALLGELSADEQKKIREIGPAILEWIAASDENAARFFADPVGSLEKAGVELDPVVLRKIKQLRSRSLQPAPSLPRARIKMIKVGVQRPN